MRVLFVERLQPLLLRGDPSTARAVLRSLSPDERREAQQWFLCSKRWLNQLHTLDYEGADYDEQLQNRWNAYWIVAMCAVRIRGEPADVLTRGVRAALVHHDLPAPSGRTFYWCWLAGSPALPLPADHGPAEDAERLACDPLMPGLLFGYLASGNCGSDPWLPAVTAELVGRAALTDVPAKPSDLPQLLRMLTAYAVEAPQPEAPEALRRFAAEKGAGRSHVEARAPVAALEDR